MGSGQPSGNEKETQVRGSRLDNVAETVHGNSGGIRLDQQPFSRFQYSRQRVRTKRTNSVNWLQSTSTTLNSAMS